MVNLSELSVRPRSLLRMRAPTGAPCTHAVSSEGQQCSAVEPGHLDLEAHSKDLFELQYIYSI